MASSELSYTNSTERRWNYETKFQFLRTPRPWLDLYGVRLQPVSYSATIGGNFVDPALIHRYLPDELLVEIFARLSPYSLGRAACVCKKWRYATRNPIFWRPACLKTWQLSGTVENYRLFQYVYDGSWRKMWLLRPRLRCDGLYVSRNTYIHTGVAEWKIDRPVHLVCYFRYLRFSPIGRFLYKNSSQKIKEVSRFMNFHASKANCVFSGCYSLIEDKVEATVLYPGLCPTVLRINLRLRGTIVGANNRLDVLSLVTSGSNDAEAGDCDENVYRIAERQQVDAIHDPDIPVVSHQRGLMPFVFVPFEEVESSILNLPVEEMDYFVPG